MSFFNPPQTLQRAIEHLQSTLPLKDRAFIAKLERKDLNLIRLTFGAHIRDECGLATGNPGLVRSCARFTHRQGLTADGAIDVLIEVLWKTLRETHSIRVVKTEGTE